MWRRSFVRLRLRTLQSNGARSYPLFSYKYEVGPRPVFYLCFAGYVAGYVAGTCTRTNEERPHAATPTPTETRTRAIQRHTTHEHKAAHEHEHTKTVYSIPALTSIATEISFIHFIPSSSFLPSPSPHFTCTLRTSRFVLRTM